MEMKRLLDELLAQGLAEGCFPGAVAACGSLGEVYAVSSVGVLAPGENAVNSLTRYDMASLTKILSTTMLAFLALEEGKLTLWDTLSDYFAVPEDKRDINIFELMTHTAGFVPFIRLDQTCASSEDALNAILASELISAPGAAPNYSCMGYITLGKILEQIYCDNLANLAREKVFKPLGMSLTGYLPEGDNIAFTEINPDTGKLICGVVHDENARFLHGISGNAGVFSNIGDMLIFCEMLSKGGSGFISKPLLDKAIVNYTPGHDVHRGLGFHLAGTEYNFIGDLFPACSYGHTGFTGTSIAIDPTTGFYVILLSNRVCPTRENLKLMRFRRCLHNALYANFSKLT